MAHQSSHAATSGVSTGAKVISEAAVGTSSADMTLVTTSSLISAKIVVTTSVVGAAVISSAALLQTPQEQIPTPFVSLCNLINPDFRQGSFGMTFEGLERNLTNRESRLVEGLIIEAYNNLTRGESYLETGCVDEFLREMQNVSLTEQVFEGETGESPSTLDLSFDALLICKGCSETMPLFGTSRPVDERFLQESQPEVEVNPNFIEDLVRIVVPGFVELISSGELSSISFPTKVFATPKSQQGTESTWDNDSVAIGVSFGVIQNRIDDSASVVFAEPSTCVEDPVEFHGGVFKFCLEGPERELSFKETLLIEGLVKETYNSLTRGDPLGGITPCKDSFGREATSATLVDQVLEEPADSNTKEDASLCLELNMWITCSGCSKHLPLFGKYSNSSLSSGDDYKSMFDINFMEENIKKIVSGLAWLINREDLESDLLPTNVHVKPPEVLDDDLNTNLRGNTFINGSLYGEFSPCKARTYRGPNHIYINGPLYADGRSPCNVGGDGGEESKDASLISLPVGVVDNKIIGGFEIVFPEPSVCVKEDVEVEFHGGEFQLCLDGPTRGFSQDEMGLIEDLVVESYNNETRGQNVDGTTSCPDVFSREMSSVTLINQMVDQGSDNGDSSLCLTFSGWITCQGCPEDLPLFGVFDTSKDDGDTNAVYDTGLLQDSVSNFIQGIYDLSRENEIDSLFVPKKVIVKPPPETDEESSAVKPDGSSTTPDTFLPNPGGSPNSEKDDDVLLGIPVGFLGVDTDENKELFIAPPSTCGITDADFHADTFEVSIQGVEGEFSMEQALLIANLFQESYNNVTRGELWGEDSHTCADIYGREMPSSTILGQEFTEGSANALSNLKITFEAWVICKDCPSKDPLFGTREEDMIGDSQLGEDQVLDGIGNLPEIGIDLGLVTNNLMAFVIGMTDLVSDDELPPNFLPESVTVENDDGETIVDLPVSIEIDENGNFVVIFPMPSESPTATFSPSSMPSTKESLSPTIVPSVQPSGVQLPTESQVPSDLPSESPSRNPSESPSALPSSLFFSPQPSMKPSGTPSIWPSESPSAVATLMPTVGLSRSPSIVPTDAPSALPTAAPSWRPTSNPSITPTSQPSTVPTNAPTPVPTAQPTPFPSSGPSSAPTIVPSLAPTAKPTPEATTPPSVQPSNHPSWYPFSEKPSMSICCPKFKNSNTCANSNGCQRQCLWDQSQGVCLDSLVDGPPPVEVCCPKFGDASSCQNSNACGKQCQWNQSQGSCFDP